MKRQSSTFIVGDVMERSLQDKCEKRRLFFSPRREITYDPRKLACQRGSMEEYCLHEDSLQSTMYGRCALRGSALNESENKPTVFPGQNRARKNIRLSGAKRDIFESSGAKP
jgi:hypothetical protein